MKEKYFKLISISLILIILNKFNLCAQKKTYKEEILEKTNVFSITNSLMNMKIDQIESEFATWEQFASKQFGTTSLIVDFVTLNSLGDFKQTENIGKGKTYLGRILIGVDFFTKYYYATDDDDMKQAWRELGWNIGKEVTQEIASIVGSAAALPVIFVSYILDESYSTIIGGYDEKLWTLYDNYYYEKLLGKNIGNLKAKMLKGENILDYLNGDPTEWYTGYGYDSARFRQVVPKLSKKFMSEHKEEFEMVARIVSKELAEKKRKEYEAQLRQEMKNFKDKLEKQKIKFTGIVKNSKNNNPIKGAKIRGLTGGYAVSDAEGKFKFEISLINVYTDNSVTLKVESKGYIPVEEYNVTDLKANPEDNQVIEIKLDPVSGIIQGIVTDAVENEPINDAKLELSKLDMSVKTDSNGEYRFEEVIPDKYEISVTKEGYDPVTVKISFPENKQNTDKESIVTKNIKLNPAKLIIAGRVITATEKKPLSNTKIRINYKDKQTVTNDAGLYYFNELVPGDYKITASHIGFRDSSVDVNVPQPKSKEPLEIKVSDIALEQIKTEVKFVSPTEGQRIENLRPVIKAIVTAENNTVLPDSALQLIFDGSQVEFKYNPTSGELFYTPSADLKETQENLGKHTAKLIVTIPQFGTDKPPEILSDNLSFIAGNKPVISQFNYNTKYPTKPDEEPFIIGIVSDDGSGIDKSGTRIILDGIDIAADVYLLEDNKTAHVVYFPKSSPAGGKHNATLYVRDIAGFENSSNISFITEGPNLNVVKNSIVIDDSKGNGNGKFDSGETVTLTFNLQNTGTMPAEEVSATIYSESSKYITVNQSLCQYGTIEPNKEGYPQGTYSSYIISALNIGQSEKTEPIEVIMNVVIKDKTGIATWTDSFNLTIYPLFYVTINKLAEPILDRVQTITGIVSDPKVNSAILILNGESIQIPVTPSETGDVGTFSQKVSLKAEADSVNTIKVIAVNERGEKAEDSMQVVVQVPPVTMKVQLTWNTATDVDLWVTDPYGESIGYYHMRSAHGGWLDFDDTSGYGPEVFTQEGFLPGTYTIKVNHFDDKDNENDIPSDWYVSVVLFEGTKNEERRYYSGTLGGTGSWNTVAVIDIPTAINKTSSVFGDMFSKSYEAIFITGGPNTPPAGFSNPPQKK